MNIPKKQVKEIINEFNAGGTDNVPPALCPPTAYSSACVPAHVERTGGAVTNENKVSGIAGHPGGNSPISFPEWAA
jgi:hypothetical protein